MWKAVAAVATRRRPRPGLLPLRTNSDLSGVGQHAPIPPSFPCRAAYHQPSSSNNSSKSRTRGTHSSSSFSASASENVFRPRIGGGGHRRPSRRRPSPPPAPSLSSPEEWLSSKNHKRTNLGFAILRASTGDLHARHVYLVELMQRCHGKGMHREVLRTFQELCELKQEEYAAAVSAAASKQNSSSPSSSSSNRSEKKYVPISPSEVALALSSAVASNHPVAMDRAVKGFFNSFPQDHKQGLLSIIEEDLREGGEGKLGGKKAEKKWWEVIAAAMPKEDGWKAMWALYQEARRRGVEGGREGGRLRKHVLRMLEEAAARSAAAGPAAVGGGGREGGRGVGRRELELSVESSIEELLLGTLSPSMAPRALWLLEMMEEEEEGREEGLNSSKSSTNKRRTRKTIEEEEGREGRRRRRPTPKDYHGAISLLVQGGLVDEGLTLLRRLVAQGDRMSLPLPSSYRVIIGGYCRLGRRKSALYLLQDLREGGRDGGWEEEERECVRLIERIGKEGEDGREEEVEQQQLQQQEEGGKEGVPTLELLRTLTDTYGLSPPLSSYSRVMKGLGEGGRESEALEWLKNMKVRGVKPDVWCYNYALMACARSGGREGGRDGGRDVRRMLDEMEEGEKSAFTYSLVIEGLGKAGGWEEAREVLYEMRRRGVQPSVGCYSSAINALGKAGRAREAMELLKEMKEEGEGKGGREGGVRPNAVVYTAAIDACARRGMVEEAVDLLREMEEGGGEGGREGGGLPPNPVAYGCAINACARGREGRRAVGLLREMQEKGLEVTEVHYGAAINGLNLSEEDDELLLQLYEEARGRGVTMVVGMWAAAIKAGDRMGAYGTVVKVGEEMIKTGHLPNKRALRLLILAAERGGRYEEGVGFFERVVRGGEEGREGGVEPCEAANKYALVCAEKVGDVVMLLGCMKRAERMGREGEGKGVEGWMCRLAARVLNRVEVEKEGEGGREEEERRMAVVELEAMVGLWRRKADEQTRRKKSGGGVWGQEGEVMFEGEKRLGSWVSVRGGRGVNLANTNRGGGRRGGVK